MKRSILIKIAAIVVAACALVLTGCANPLSGNDESGSDGIASGGIDGEYVNPGDTLGGGGAAEDTVTVTPSETVTEFSAYTALYASSDEYASVQLATDIPDDATVITLNNELTSISGSGAVYENGRVNITAEGVYVLSGTLNGQVYVNVDKQVRLVLNGVNITCDNSAAIAMFGKKKKVITVADGTTNTLKDGATYSADGNGYYDDSLDEEGEINNEPNAALFSKKSLTINGGGTLCVEGNYSYGINCKDALYLLGGTLNVTAADNGIKGKDNVIAGGANVSVTAGGDGIKTDVDLTDESEYLDTDNSTDELGYILGNVIINSGDVSIISDSDGIQADHYLIINDANLTITANGGSDSADTDTGKGIKAESAIYIASGNIDINAADDAIHSDNTLTIDGGTLTLATGDDAAHADEFLIINDGVIDISTCYEGIESKKITINGGEITLTATDDGINAADGSGSESMASDPECYIVINGGDIYVDAAGDGVDSNGTIVMNGGIMYIDGPTSGADASIDTNGGMTVNGGMLVAIGSSGMVETPSTSSAQNVISFSAKSTIAAGTVFEIKNGGETILRFTTGKNAQSFIMSDPDFVRGETYDIYGDGTLLSSATINSVITSVGYGNNNSWGGGNWDGQGGGFRPGGR